MAHTTIKQLEELNALKELSPEQRKRVLLKKEALERRMELIESILSRPPKRRRCVKKS